MERLAIIFHFNGYPTGKWYRVSLHAKQSTGEYNKQGFTKFFETEKAAIRFAEKYADKIEYRKKRGVV